MKIYMLHDAEGQARLQKEEERQKRPLTFKSEVGADMPPKMQKIVGRKIGCDDWTGSGREPHSVFWKDAVKHALTFKNFDLDEIKDNLLPVAEDPRNCRLLTCRTSCPMGLTKKRCIINSNKAMFKSDKNARYAITVLQFLQAAGMTKDDLERVKKELALGASYDLRAVNAQIENAMLDSE